MRYLNPLESMFIKVCELKKGEKINFHSHENNKCDEPFLRLLKVIRLLEILVLFGKYMLSLIV